MAEKKSVYATLSRINVNAHTERKNGLTYLSWAWAWASVKENYPEAFYTIYEDEAGRFYHTDGRTAWVKTGVTIEGLEHVEYLPVMDHRNRSIPIDQITSFAVNTAIQRSLTKAVARHGLGLYIYAGEDLPADDAERPAEKTGLDATKKKAVVALCENEGVDLETVLAKMNLKSLDQMTIDQFMWLNKYRDRINEWR